MNVILTKRDKSFNPSEEETTSQMGVYLDESLNSQFDGEGWYDIKYHIKNEDGGEYEGVDTCFLYEQNGRIYSGEVLNK